MDTRTAKRAVGNSARQWQAATWAWLILIGLTLSMLAAGHMALSGGGVVALLLGATLLKAQLVADVFMGLRHTRLLWRMIVTLYLITVIGLIGLAYWLGNA